ncbi:MAG: UDP-N-acetylmuramate:L-alanyl-gamma-D-glutamyl-meso-diaminopimelate ligase, partial [Methylophilaceae bacterium]|nr:UDP-N-acetylmuramate:L-alanyl-gamma-D-glutamyl-meso-diaminopimelate ligase [Methylophilaceae bacterium]
PDSLTAADWVFCYGGNVDWDVAEALKPIEYKSQVFMQMDALIQAITNLAQPHDTILVMSNGGFDGIHQKLLDQLV